MRGNLLVLMLGLAVCLPACDEGGGGNGDPDSGTDDDAGVDSGPDSTLDLGEVRILDPGDDGSFSFDLETSSEDEQYVLLLTSGSRHVLGSYQYEVTVDGEVMGQPAQTGSYGYDSSMPPMGVPAGWTQAVNAVMSGAKPPISTKADPPQEGDTISLTISSGSGYVDIDCEVMSVTDELVIVFDRTTVADLDVDAEILDEVAQNFSEVVLPRERIYFGQESDVNDDGHVTMLFSPLVYTGSGGATAYVYPCDLLEDGTSGCPSSNEQELIYMSPPDLLTSYMGTADAITETLAHEFQHAIYFYRKFMLNDDVSTDESAYITEGMSAMAQDLSGFQAGNLYVAGAAIDGVDDVCMASVLDYPAGYNDEYDGIYRGAAYLFLRYIFDQLGGDTIDGSGEVEDLGGIGFLNDMSDLAIYGYDGIEAAAGETAEELIARMYTAMLLDDREVEGEPLCNDPIYGFAPVWEDPITGKQHGTTMNYDLAGGSWPVRGVPVQQGGADGALWAGGAEYILIMGTGEEFAIEASSEATALMGARIVRIN